MRILTRLQRLSINGILLVVAVLTTAVPTWAATGTHIFTTVPDFSTCENGAQPTMVNTALSAEVNGEIGLRPQLSDDFSGSLIDPALWTSGIYTSTLNPGGSPPDVAVGNNLVMVSSSNQSPLDGSYLRASQIQQYGTIEGEVLFSKG